MSLPDLFRLRLPAAAQAARVILSTSVIALLGYTTSRATDRYWDSNGATPGGSDTTTATGTWGTDNFWNTDSLGGAGTFITNPTNTDDLHFSAGTNVTGAYTVTVTGAQTANSLIFEEGAVTLPVNAGASITLGGGAGSNTGIVFVNGTGANTIATALTLAANAAFTNNSSSNQIISGNITGAGTALTLAATSTGTITLSGSNSGLTGPVTIKAGTINVTTANALGTGTVTLGDAAGGSIAATLAVNGTITIANPITLASSTTGALTLRNSGTGAVTFSGGVSGNNNFTIDAANTGTLTLSGSAGINNVGTLTHTGSGNGLTTISSVIGANVTQVIQNSATSQITLSNGNNAFGSLFIKSGIVMLSQNTAGQFSAGGVGTITLGDSAGSASAILELQGTAPTYNNPVVLGSTAGALTIQLQNTGTAGTFSGGITGNNSVILSTAGTGAGTAQLTFLTGDLNNTGTITNGTVGGTGNLVIQSVIGANVTGLIQNSATSKMVLSNAEAYTGPTSILKGTLELASGSSLSDTAINVASGATLLISSDTFIGSGGNASLSVAGGGNLTTTNGAASQITLMSGSGNVVNFGGTGSTPAIWNIDVGPTADNIFLTGDNASGTIGSAGLTLNVTALAAGISHLDQNIVFAPGGFTATGPLTVNATTGNFGGYTLGLQVRSDGLWLTETANPTPAVAYWSGAQSTAWNFFTGGNANNSNWLNGPAGTDTHAAPGATTNVFLTADTATNLATTLGQNFEINSLTFTGTGTAGSGTVNVGGAFFLTIDATSANGNTAGVGITKQLGSGSNTISAGVILGGSQSWSNNASTNLGVTGGVTGTADLTLNTNGAGAITISTTMIDITGRIIAAGTGTGTVTISAPISSNVTSVTQAGASPFTISSLFTLTDTNRTLVSTGSGTFTFSGGIAGTGDVMLRANSTGNITLSGVAGVNHTGTITNVGAGTGTSTITAALGSTVGQVIQNSATSALTLAGNNTAFTSGAVAKLGTLNVSSNANALGTAAVTLGDSTPGNTNSASLLMTGGTALTIANAINVVAGSSGTLTLGIGPAATQNVNFSGPITLNNNLTLSTVAAGRLLTISGGITGTGNLTTSSNGGTMTVSSLINNSGTITNVSAGAGTTTLSGGIGSNVTAITEASATNAVTISTNAITVNSGGTTLTNTGGAILTVSGGIVGTGNLILNNNNAIAGAITITTTAINNTGTVTNSGTGTGGLTIGAVIGSNVTGVIQNSATSSLTLTGVNTYAGATSVLGGSLILSGTGSINSSSGITINGSTARLVQTATTALTPTITLTQGTLDGTTTVGTVNVGNSAGTIVTAGNGGAGVLTIGTLSFGGASNINLAANGATMASTLAITNLSTNAAGNVLFNLTNSGLWSNATYNLLTYGGGSIGGAGFSAFQVGTITNLSARQTYVLNNTGTAITLTISGGDIPIWTGALDGRWTTATLSAPKNWKLQTAGTTTDFMTNDTVLFDDTATGTTTVTISDADVRPLTTTFNNSTVKSYTINGPFGIAAGSFTKSNTGTVTINTVNTYSGPTAIQGGTVVLGVNNALPTGTALTLGNNLTGANSRQGILDMTNVNQTIGSLTVSSDSTTANQILVGSGKTLTINGNVTVGENNTSKTNVKLTMSGGGSLVVNNSAANAVFQVGGNTTTTTTAGNNATADLSGLSSVTITLNTTTGAVNVGDNVNLTANSGVASTLLLPTTGAGNTTITAASLNVGFQGRNSVIATDHFVNALKLGSGANNFNVNTFNVGSGVRDAGSVTFTNGSGTLTLRDATGTGRAILNVGTGASNTGANRANTFDVSGHLVDLLISTLTVGNGIGTGVQTNIFAMDQGTLDATSLIMGRRGDGGGTGSAFPFTTTVTFGANAASTETVTIGTGGVTLLNQQATIAASSANAADVSSLNILGGTVTVGGDIIQTVIALASNHTGTLNLDGGTLDMTGKKIGGSTAATNIDVLRFASGTLKNVAEINNGAGLTKITSGTLTIAGTNTYTGTTTVKAGTVVVSGSITGTASVVVGDSASLTTAAILGGTGSLGNLTVGAAAGNTGATLMPHAGSTSTSAGSTLSTGSVTFFDGSAHLSLELGRTSAFTGSGGNGTAGGDVSDHVNASGLVTLNGADLDLTLLNTTGYNIGQNDVFFLIINGSGSAIGGTFAALNGVATSLTEGAQFTFNSQQYTITYQANFAGNSYTGGNDVAVRLISVPEPGALVSMMGGLGVVLWRRRRRG